MRSGDPSPLWPWAGATLAVLFVLVSAWETITVERLASEVSEHSAALRLLDEARVAVRDAKSASIDVPPPAPREPPSAPSLRELRRALEAVRTDPSPELARRLGEVDRLVAELERLQAERFERGHDPAVAAAFHRLADDTAEELDGAVGHLRARTSEISRQLGARWRETHALLLVSSALAIGIAWLLRRNQRDVRALREAEAALRESQARLRAVVDNAPVVLWSVDADGVFTLSEGAGLHSLGLRPGEVVGRSLFELYADQPRVLDNARRSLSGEALSEVVDLDELSFQIYQQPLRDSTGRIVGIIGVATDVTERRRTEEALRRSEEQRLQSQKAEAIGRLAGGVAHEFSNLLTVISGFATLLRDQLPDTRPERRELDQILRAAERAAELTQQLLAFSRRHRSERRVVDLAEVLSGWRPMLRTVAGEAVDLRLDVALAPAYVAADPTVFQQVLINLVLNARDAMPSGGRLEVRLDERRLRGEVARDGERLDDGPYARLAVRDDGVGMEPEVLDRVFEPFFTTKEPGKGTGLGLPTCYGIVRELGGDIRVTSHPGAGSTFEVLLPRADVEELAPAAPAAEPSAAPRGTETVLLVEDDPQVRAFAARALRDHGYFVLEARHADEALALAGDYDGPIDVLVTDVVMPGSSGRALASRLVVQRPRTRVLFVSGYPASELDGEDGTDLPFLQKPFTPEELARAVRAEVDAAATSQPAS